MSCHTQAGYPAPPPLPAPETPAADPRRPTGVAADGLLLLVPLVLYAALFVALVGLSAAHEISRLTTALGGRG